MPTPSQISSLFPFSQPQQSASPFESLLMPFAFNQQQMPPMAPQVAQPIPTSQDPTSVLMQAIAAKLANPSETRGSSGQPGRRYGTGGGEITAADPTGSGASGFFSTPEQVQANLASGKTINSMSPALMQYNQQNAAGVPQSQVIPTAQQSVFGPLTMEGPFGTGYSQAVPPPAGPSPGFAEAMQLKYQQNPFAMWAQSQQSPFSTAQVQNYR